MDPVYLEALLRRAQFPEERIAFLQGLSEEELWSRSETRPRLRGVLHAAEWFNGVKGGSVREELDRIRAIIAPLSWVLEDRCSYHRIRGVCLFVHPFLVSPSNFQRRATTNHFVVVDDFEGIPVNFARDAVPLGVLCRAMRILSEFDERNLSFGTDCEFYPNKAGDVHLLGTVIVAGDDSMRAERVAFWLARIRRLCPEADPRAEVSTFHDMEYRLHRLLHPPKQPISTFLDCLEEQFQLGRGIMWNEDGTCSLNAAVAMALLCLDVFPDRTPMMQDIIRSLSQHILPLGTDMMDHLRQVLGCGLPLVSSLFFHLLFPLEEAKRHVGSIGRNFTWSGNGIFLTNQPTADHFRRTRSFIVKFWTGEFEAQSNQHWVAVVRIKELWYVVSDDIAFPLTTGTVHDALYMMHKFPRFEQYLPASSPARHFIRFTDGVPVSIARWCNPCVGTYTGKAMLFMGSEA